MSRHGTPQLGRAQANGQDFSSQSSCLFPDENTPRRRSEIVCLKSSLPSLIYVELKTELPEKGGSRREGVAVMVTVRSVGSRISGSHSETPINGVRKLLSTGLADTGCPYCLVLHRSKSLLGKTLTPRCEISPRSEAICTWFMKISKLQNFKTFELSEGMLSQ
jgi:hypothetical protein